MGGSPSGQGACLHVLTPLSKQASKRQSRRVSYRDSRDAWSCRCCSWGRAMPSDSVRLLVPWSGRGLGSLVSRFATVLEPVCRDGATIRAEPAVTGSCQPGAVDEFRGAGFSHSANGHPTSAKAGPCICEAMSSTCKYIANLCRRRRQPSKQPQSGSACS